MSETDSKRLLGSQGSGANVLPETSGHQSMQPDDNSLAGKYEKNKKAVWGGAAGLLLLIIIIIVASSGGDSPTPPVPPTPPTPGPPDYSINPYYLDMNTYAGDKTMQTGTLRFNHTRFSPKNIHQHIQKQLNEDFGVEGGLNFTIDPQLIPSGQNNNITENVTFHVSQVCFTTTRIWFGNEDQSQVYNPPADVVNTETATNNNTLESQGFMIYANPFEFEMRSTRTEKDTLLNMKDSDFVISDRYLQLDLQVPTTRIYGFGERHRQFTLEKGTWTMWANGQDSNLDNGQGGMQTYGVHPFALIQTMIPGEFFGIYFRNTNAASPVIRHNSSNGTRGDFGSVISYITTGGEIEFFVFTKSDARGIIKQYHNFIGKPALPPFWALGWHAGNTADETNSLDDVKQMVLRYKQNGIPLEGVWLDVPYMNNYQPFTVASAWSDIKTFTTQLKADDQKLVVIVGPGLVSSDKSNKYYSSALAKNALIKSTINTNTTGSALTSKVWPEGSTTAESTVFLDWFSQDAKDIWTQGLQDLYDQVPYDGLWLDHNEATGNCDGECPGSVSAQATLKKDNEKFFYVETSGQEFVNNTWNSVWSNQDEISTFYLPFTPGYKNLDTKTLSLNGTHPSNGLNEYDVHNLFGHMEGKVTNEFLLNHTATPVALQDKRPFIMSRSTFAGSGAHVAHGLGREHRTWEDMALGIAGVMNFNMFGIPMTGPNACGYYGATREDEMCGRWIQLSSMFPLARQHKDKHSGNGGPDNEPYLLKAPYNQWAKNALINRYQYIRQIYTCLFEANQDGGTCVDPLFYHYPEDIRTFDPTQTENSFILAGALKVVPVLEAIPTGKTTIDIRTYFPLGEWVNMANYSDIQGNLLTGSWLEVPAPTDTENILTYLKPGSLVAFQPNTGQWTTTTEILNDAELHLVANIDPNGWASGTLFVDKGVTTTEIENFDYEYYQFHLSAGSLKKWVLNDKNLYPAGRGLDSLTIVNAETHRNVNFACWVSNDETINPVNITYDATKKSLKLWDTKGPIDLTRLRDLYYGNNETDQNLCVGILGHEKQFYKIKDGEAPDLTGNAPLTIQLVNNVPTAHPDLNITITVTEASMVNIRWNYAHQPGTVKTPYEIPSSIIDIDLKPGHLPLDEFIQWHTRTGNEDVGEFILTVVNPKDKQPIFSLHSNMQLNQHLNMWEGFAHTRKENFQGIMGLADQTATDLFLGNGTYTLWNRGAPEPAQTGKYPAENTYGSHPFVMGAAEDGSWFGVYSNVAAAQDWILHNEEASGDVAINFIATGGRGDLTVFTGDTPNEVVSLYHERIVGLPVVTPQWALGWHQSRWGYKDTAFLQQVVDEYKAAQLPLDGIWSDIDYLEDYRNFEIDPYFFGDLGQFVKNLTNEHWVPVVDVGISQRIRSVSGKTPYIPYLDGDYANVFLNASASIQTPFTGRGWGDDVVYVDFTNPNATEFWSGWLNELQGQAAFSGLWLNMNEATSRCDGHCYYDQRPSHLIQRNLKYIPGGRNLEEKAIALDAVHFDGSVELDAHSLYGAMQSEATATYFTETLKKRPMAISRSTFAGQGKYSSRSLGDNYSTQQYLTFSVTGVMSANIAGTPLAGADICGYIGDTNADLCARWYTIGSFYPFSRNHNHRDAVAQEPYEFEGVVPHHLVQYTYLDVMRWAMWNKMCLIRYYYSEMSHVQRYGGAFFKPLFFEFPDDPEAYGHQVRNVMLGSHLKLGIVPDFGHSSTGQYGIYFPKGMWCEVFNKKGRDGCTYQSIAGNRDVEAQYPWDFYLHLRQGSIIPFQDQYAIKALATAQLQDHPTTFHILPDCWEVNTGGNCIASGRYSNDDGESLNKTESNQYLFKYLQPEGQDPASLTFTVINKQHIGAINGNDYIGGIEIYNAAEWGMNNTAGYSVEATLDDGSKLTLASAVYDAVTDRLVYAIGHSSENEVALPDLDTLVFTRES